MVIEIAAEMDEKLGVISMSHATVEPQVPLPYFKSVIHATPRILGSLHDNYLSTAEAPDERNSSDNIRTM